MQVDTWIYEEATDLGTFDKRPTYSNQKVIQRDLMSNDISLTVNHHLQKISVETYDNGYLFDQLTFGLSFY